MALSQPAGADLAEDASRQGALEAGLLFVSDRRAGIRRRKRGGGFVYVRPDGSQISKHQDLARIKAVAVPPAWRNVWICAEPRGHLQATGRDARGRKQYRYHTRWREARDAKQVRPDGRLRPGAAAG